jgi:hypothetical protein
MNRDISFLITLLNITDCDILVREVPKSSDFNKLVNVLIQEFHLIGSKVSEANLSAHSVS